MATKVATRCKEKAVQVTVYVETPRRSRLSSNNHHCHHQYHHHHHHYIHHPKHGANGERGYNRRADPLDYSRRLRASVQSGPSMPLLRPQSVPSESSNQPTTQMIGVESKTKGSKPARFPSCLGNIPSFLRSLITLQAKKKRKKKEN